MTLALLQAPAAGGGPNPLIANLLLIGGMVALFYFLIIRPQSKARKQMEERLSKLKAGDEVLLSSGLFATIDRLDEKDAKVRLSLLRISHRFVDTFNLTPKHT